MIKTYGEDAPSYTILTMVKRWSAEFREGREGPQHDPCPGRPATAMDQKTISRVHDLVMAYWWLTTWNSHYGHLKPVFLTIWPMSSLGGKCQWDGPKTSDWHPNVRLIQHSYGSLRPFEGDFWTDLWLQMKPLYTWNKGTVEALETLDSEGKSWRLFF